MRLDRGREDGLPLLQFLCFGVETSQIALEARVGLGRRLRLLPEGKFFSRK